MTHYIEQCKRCYTVMGQCRCIDKNKELLWSICEKCNVSDGSGGVGPIEVLPDDRLEKIAFTHMGFRDLNTRDSDTQDFREVAVWNVKRALEDAYALGKGDIK